MPASVGQAGKGKSEMVVVCHLCSQSGHRKADCPKKPQRRGTNSQRQCRKRHEKKKIQSEMGKGKLPFLLTLQHGTNQKQSICRPLESRSQTISFPILVNKRILTSAHGWLVLVDVFNEECCLWNPSSEAVIELPTLEKSYYYKKCVLSKPPTEPDCHILFNSRRRFDSPDFYKQSFCKIGDVEYVQEEFQLVATASFKGKIYGIMNPGYEFVTIEFVGKTMEFKPILINGEQPWKAPTPNRNCVLWHHNEFIDSLSDNELLLVIKDFTHHNDIINGIDGSEYRVFRVDINQTECIEVDDIGDHAILIGYYGNGYCCSSNGGTNTFKPNSIYHTIYFGAHVYVYDLNAKSTTTWLPHDVAKIKLSNNYWLDLEELSR